MNKTINTDNNDLLEMTGEITKRLITQFNSEEQHQFLKAVHHTINDDYECKIKECSALLDDLKSNHDSFLGREPNNSN